MVVHKKWLALLLVGACCFPGCVKPPEDNLGAAIKRGKEKPKAANDLQQMAYFYTMYSSEHGRPPASWPDFKAYIQRDASASMMQAIEEGRYVVSWNARLGSSVVLAYERDVDLNGNQVVVMGDASVHTMKTQELQAALRKGG
jgi:hypothetical protein